MNIKLCQSVKGTFSGARGISIVLMMPDDGCALKYCEFLSLDVETPWGGGVTLVGG